MKTRLLILATIATILSVATSAQGLMSKPVRFKVEKKQVNNNTFDVLFSATIDKGWHVYSPGLPAGGPVSASIAIDKSEGVEAEGPLKAIGNERNVYDEMFGMNVRYFEDAVTFSQRFKTKGGKYDVSGRLVYGSCNDQMCLPPTSVDFSYNGEAPKVKDNDEKKKEEEAPSAAAEENDGKRENTTQEDATTLPDSAATTVGTTLNTEPTTLNAQHSTLNTQQSKSGLLSIFLMGLLGGFVALLTPCVWPIIPMTVSFFLKRAKDNKRKAVSDALTYGLSIIVIYLTLGLAVTAIYGAQRLNDLATNAYVNLFFFALLVVFALSFFGWFEITLPSSWGNKLDSKASKTGGLLGIFLMAFTLAIVSFSCTGPIVGFLLVDFSTSGNIVAPAIGMLGFALALALPFTLFALFPSWLKQAPKSGAWMNTVKVTLGFIELAFALKFFSVADLAYGWHLLDREVFLCLWIAIFFLLGLYLCGMLHFQSDAEADGTIRPKPVVAIMGGLVSIAFAIYMVPGLWGAPCKAVSAFTPPMSTQDFNLNSKEVKAAFLNYEEGLAEAERTGKPVLLDFTGYGCVNCRKMEAAVWTDPQVAETLNNDYILVSLYVDDKTPLEKNIEVTMPNGTKKTLRTVGDKWSYLQETKFGYLAQPFYVAVNSKGEPLSGSFAYKEDPRAYLKFLKEGLESSKHQTVN
ncbi:MAG: cytochrome c biogenesis protein CcdA [Prevotella sp.]|nr:cytochrome c biogenesis protein CcdA [Prevotella sp.]